VEIKFATFKGSLERSSNLITRLKHREFVGFPHEILKIWQGSKSGHQNRGIKFANNPKVKDFLTKAEANTHSFQEGGQV